MIGDKCGARQRSGIDNRAGAGAVTWLAEAGRSCRRKETGRHGAGAGGERDQMPSRRRSRARHTQATRPPAARPIEGNPWPTISGLVRCSRVAATTLQYQHCQRWPPRSARLRSPRWASIAVVVILRDPRPPGAGVLDCWLPAFGTTALAYRANLLPATRE